jgi:hypothetical protein
MKTNWIKSGVFFYLNALKMSEITVFDVIDDGAFFIFKILVGIYCLRLITKTGKTRKYFARNMKYQ